MDGIYVVVFLSSNELVTKIEGLQILMGYMTASATYRIGAGSM